MKIHEDETEIEVMYLKAKGQCQESASQSLKLRGRPRADFSMIPGLERSPEEGNGNPVQYSCLKNLMDRGAWRATIYGVTKSQIRLRD